MMAFCLPALVPALQLDIFAAVDAAASDELDSRTELESNITLLVNNERSRAVAAVASITTIESLAVYTVNDVLATQVGFTCR